MPAFTSPLPIIPVHFKGSSGPPAESPGSGSGKAGPAHISQLTSQGRAARVPSRPGTATQHAGRAGLHALQWTGGGARPGLSRCVGRAGYISHLVFCKLHGDGLTLRAHCFCHGFHLSSASHSQVLRHFRQPAIHAPCFPTVWPAVTNLTAWNVTGEPLAYSNHCIAFSIKQPVSL